MLLSDSQFEDSWTTRLSQKGIGCTVRVYGGTKAANSLPAVDRKSAGIVRIGPTLGENQ